MKVIFIPVSDRPECAMALHHGFVLGQQTAASVIGCHIRAHSTSDIKLHNQTTESMLTLDSYDMAWEAALKENGKEEDHVKAQLLFKKMAEQFDFKLTAKPKNKPTAQWLEKVGSPEHLFSIMGPTADLILVSRPAKKGHSLAKKFMFSAVMNSSSPVLVLPQTKVDNLGKRICIAWNQSPEATKAVKAALPLLSNADEVNIITSGPENRLGPKAKHLINYLTCWNVSAKHVPIKESSDQQAILKGYKETKSDLLIMGGYSRNRLRQRVFGGVTEYMLNEAKMPIFILHS